MTTHKAAVSPKRQQYPEQAPFTLSPIQTAYFQPKPPKKNKLNPHFFNNRVVHVTMMPLKINELQLQKRADRIASQAT